MIGSNLTKYRDEGLLLLRLGIGIAFMFYGWPKLVGGPKMWTGLGHAGGFFFLPAAWGFLAALIEFFGGLLVALGLAFRVATALLFIQMMVALAHHLRGGDPFMVYSHALELGIVCLSLVLIGPGKYSIDKK